MGKLMAEPRPRAGDRSVYRFLHLCLQGRWDHRALQKARSLGSPGMVEWKVLGQLAETEGLAPLLYQAVRCQHLVPAALMVHPATARRATL